MLPWPAARMIGVTARLQVEGCAAVRVEHCVECRRIFVCQIGTTGEAADEMDEGVDAAVNGLGCFHCFLCGIGGGEIGFDCSGDSAALYRDHLCACREECL